MLDNPIKKDIRSLDLETLKEALKEQGHPSFRATQILEWLWAKGTRNFSEMSNLPLSIREWLSSFYTINNFSLDYQQISQDGTIKSRLALHDGEKIETVLIPVPEDKRFTVCVSTQVGCSLTCSFCATGRMGRIRNLDHSEIYDQVVYSNQLCQEKYGHPITNIVYMGMGEPLLNYSNVTQSIDKITHPKVGLGMSPRRITISTAGIAKMIKKLADDQTKCKLALSLHAASDEKRNTIMPINEHNNLAALLEALTYFYDKTKNRITYEYIAFEGFNDNIEDANLLAKLCRKFPVKVNIIEYNSIGLGTFEKSSKYRLNQFMQTLVNLGVDVTVRKSRGKDIDAACGQLANKA